MGLKRYYIKESYLKKVRFLFMFQQKGGRVPNSIMLMSLRFLCFDALLVPVVPCGLGDSGAFGTGVS